MRRRSGIFKAALSALENLPEGDERAKQELAIQLDLGLPYTAIEGYTSTNVGRSYRRALDLCDQYASTTQLCRALYGSSGFYHVGANYRPALEINYKLIEVAERTKQKEILSEARYVIGLNHFWMGNFQQAYENGKAGSEAYRPEFHAKQISEFPQDGGVACEVTIAWALWVSGIPRTGFCCRRKGDSICKKASASVHYRVRLNLKHRNASIRAQSR